jgi:hypothetical protein
MSKQGSTSLAAQRQALIGSRDRRAADCSQAPQRRMRVMSPAARRLLQAATEMPQNIVGERCCDRGGMGIPPEKPEQSKIEDDKGPQLADPKRIRTIQDFLQRKFIMKPPRLVCSTRISSPTD